MSSREHVLYPARPVVGRPVIARSVAAHSFDEHSVGFSGRWTLLWLGLRNRLSAMTGAWLQSIHAPARLRAFEYVDPDSGDTISLSTSKDYSILSVGGRRFYFGRITGKFDGASSPLAPPSTHYPHLQ